MLWVSCGLSRRLQSSHYICTGSACKRPSVKVTAAVALGGGAAAGRGLALQAMLGSLTFSPRAAGRQWGS